MTIEYSLAAVTAAAAALLITAPTTAPVDLAAYSTAMAGSATTPVRAAELAANPAGFTTVSHERVLEYEGEPKCNFDRIKTEKLKCTQPVYKKQNGPTAIDKAGDAVGRAVKGCVAGVAAEKAGERVDSKSKGKMNPSKKGKGFGEYIAACGGGAF